MRLIDADALKRELFDDYERNDMFYPEYHYEALRIFSNMINAQPTIGNWISVKDRVPEEHDSLFTNHPHLSKYMWDKESDDVIVYATFPDGTGRVTEGRLRDGKWNTKISQTLETVITHWMPLPEGPKEAIE